MQLFDKFEHLRTGFRQLLPTETYPVEIINLVNWGISTKSVIHFDFLVELSAWKISNTIKFLKKIEVENNIIHEWKITCFFLYVIVFLFFSFFLMQFNIVFI